MKRPENNRNVIFCQRIRIFCNNIQISVEYFIVRPPRKNLLCTVIT